MNNEIHLANVPDDATLPFIQDDKERIIELQQEIILLLKEKIKHLQDELKGN